MSIRLIKPAAWCEHEYKSCPADCPLDAAEGRLREAHRRWHEAAAAYQEAVHLLSAIGADRGAAQLWFDLAGLLEQVGEADSASDAYKRAAASTGLRARTSTPARTLV